jgi:Skp family chaperone for outer membrane proteins
MASTEALDIEAGRGGGGVNLPPEPEEKGALKPIAETTPLERVFGIVAGGALATSLAAIIIEQSSIVIVAGILSCIMGPYAYWQQTRLTDIAALKETHEAIQAEVNRLHQENERLSKSIGELTESVDRLEDVSLALDAITQVQGQSVGEFEKQVQENRNILKSMKTNLKSSVLQNLLSVVMSSDTDNDMVVDEEEVEVLLRRLHNIGGVEIHEGRFRAAFSGKEVSALMQVVQNLLNDKLPPEERIFEFTNTEKQ